MRLNKRNFPFLFPSVFLSVSFFSLSFFLSQLFSRSPSLFLSFFLSHLSLFLLALHFLGFAEVWDYDLEWDRLPDLSQGYTRIAAIVPSHRSHCLGIDEWICICLAPELNFSLPLFAHPLTSFSVSVSLLLLYLSLFLSSRRSSMLASRIILLPSNLDPETPKTTPIVSRMYGNSASVGATRRFKVLMN